MNKETQTVDDIVEEFSHITYPPLKGNPLQNRTDEDLLKIHGEHCKWFDTKLTTLHQAHQQELEKVRREERENYNKILEQIRIVGEECDYPVILQYLEALTPKDLTDKE